MSVRRSRFRNFTQVASLLRVRRETVADIVERAGIRVHDVGRARVLDDEGVAEVRRRLLPITTTV